MKYLLILFVFIGSNLNAQTEDMFFNAIKNGDISTLDMYLKDQIDFCLFEDQQVMNKKAALTKLKTFLEANKASGIEVMHKGSSKDKSTNYKVARLNTATGNYRVFVYTLGILGANTVKEIRIDKF
ncbi:MAG: DUF4783 domain-containing protein [Saprospiraceae bacterium]|nr:DUF4783 domain-containing protein [Saprospiraceae bacterium]